MSTDLKQTQGYAHNRIWYSDLEHTMEINMTTVSNAIESARNEVFKAMTLNEIASALSAHMAVKKLKNAYTADDIRDLNNDAVIGNQLIIEYSLRINDFRSAAEAAAEVNEILAP